MFGTRSAVLVAVAGLLACSGFAFADTGVKSPSLTLDPSTVRADAAPADETPLMMLLDKGGMSKPINDYGLKVYGWVESGYTFNNRHGSNNFPVIIPGPFTHEFGNHYMLNQIDLRVEKQVDMKKFDVGGMVEFMYGTDAARIHSTGLGYDGSDPSDNGIPADTLATANLHPIMQFDIPQAFVDISLPVGDGLKVRVGKFVTLLGYETIDPRGNPFYSHSYLFAAVPFTQTGVLVSDQLNDQWAITAGITRGYEMTMEDNNAAIDVTGQVAYAASKSINVYLNFIAGPENANDSGHYRFTIDPVITWQVTDQLKLGAEFLYLYDGGLNAGVLDPSTHAYGDIWGAALYAGYKVNDFITINGRAEKMHAYVGNLAAFNSSFSSNIGPIFSGSVIPAVNAYEITLGATITPFPTDPLGKNLCVRPEIRYDFTDSDEFKFYGANGRFFKDQLTFAADVIIKF